MLLKETGTDKILDFRGGSAFAVGFGLNVKMKTVQVFQRTIFLQLGHGAKIAKPVQ
jgi:hypothetical protein